MPRHFPRANRLAAVLLVLSFVLIVILAVPGKVIFARSGVDVARQALQTAWQNALQAKGYHFSTDVIQSTAPSVSIASAGLASKVEQYHLEGDRQSGSRTLEMTIWSSGGSTLNAASGIGLRVEDGKVYAKTGEMETWKEVNNFTDIFAPNNDPLAYLSAADNIVFTGQTAAPGGKLNHYTYAINGPAFAEFIRQQTEERFASQGRPVPEGVELGLSETYSHMAGNGELWVNAEGFPVRHVLHLRLPAQSQASAGGLAAETAEITAEVDIAFSGFQAGAPATAAGIPVQLSQAWDQVRGWSNMYGLALLLAVGFFYVLVRHSGSRKLQTALAVTLIFSMVVTPLLKSVQASGFIEQVRAEDQAAQARTDKTDLQKSLEQMQSGQRRVPAGALEAIRRDAGIDSDHDGLSDVREAFLRTNPQSGPLAGQQDDWAKLREAGINPTGLTQADTGADADGDGLTDQEEALLGTASWSSDDDHDGIPDGRDTDGDQISDYDEVSGFSYAGKTWYTDPLQQDTNKDGIDDGREWKLAGAGHDTWDLDNDQIPDLFDTDNDGDGVPDNLDLSPFQANADLFTKDRPLGVSFTGLTPGKDTFVDLQIRPGNASHLRYAFNVLDWPADTAGQIQDWDNATFASVDPSLATNPNANGDMKFVPALEIRTSGDNTSLPLTSTLPPFTAPINDVSSTGISGTVRFEQVFNGIQISSKDIVSSETPVYDLRAGIYRGTCEKLDKLVTEKIFFGASADHSNVIRNANLADYINGQYALMVYAGGVLPPEPAAKYACVDLPRLPRENGRYVDLKALEDYGISVSYANSSGEDKIIYVPLSLVTQEGGNQVAFQARLLYRPETSSWGGAQQVRLVWTVQGLVDNCQNATTCLYKNRSQMLYAYSDDFRVTGLNVREDNGAEVAAIDESPNRKQNVYPNLPFNTEDSLLALAHGLDQSFMAGVDCLPKDAAGNCQGDGQPDMTLDEIVRRFDTPTVESAKVRPTRTETWGLEMIFRVRKHDYSNIDQARIGAATLARTALYSEYTGVKLRDGTPVTSLKPTILFATVERYRSANLDQASVSGQREVSWSGGQLNMDLSGQSLYTNHSLNWKPYIFQDGGWVNYAIDSFWSDFNTRYAGEVAGETDADLRDGQVAFGKMYYLALYQGANAIRAVNGSLLPTSTAKTDDTIAGQIIDTGGGLGGKAIKYLTNKVLGLMVYGVKGTLYYPEMTLRYLSTFAREATPGYDKIAKLVNFFLDSGKWGVKRVLTSGLLVGLVLLAITAAVFAVTSLVANYVFHADWAKAPSAIILTGISIFFSLCLPIYNIIQAVKSLASEGAGVVSAFVKVIGSSSQILKSTVGAAVVGLILQIGVAFGVFLANWLSGAFAYGSIEFSNQLALTLSSIFLAVVFFVLSLSVMGTVLVGLISAVDAIFSLLCDTFEVKTACFSITGKLTEVITNAFHGSSITVNMTRADLINPTNMDMTLKDPAKGFIPGNAVKLGLKIETFLMQDWQNRLDSEQNARVIYHADAFFSPDALKRTAFNYAINADPPDAVAGSQVNQWDNVAKYVTYTDRVSYMGIPEEKTYAMYSGVLKGSGESGYIQLNKAGMNQSLPAVLHIAYAVPTALCNGVGALSGCEEKFTQGRQTGSDMGIVVDVFPTTLDEFYSLAWLGKPASQRDPDGDGAISRQFGGSDPDDTQWDTDNDGLSDGYEDQQREKGVAISASDADSDDDGINDGEEIRLGFNPASADTDKDGLSDGQEWTGWSFTYASGKTTWVRSDPRSTDTDGDTLSDFTEYNLYTANPGSDRHSPLAVNAPVTPFVTEAVGGTQYIAPGGTFILRSTISYDGSLGAGTRAEGRINHRMPPGITIDDQTRMYDITLQKDQTLVRGTDVQIKPGAASGSYTFLTDAALDIRRDGMMVGHSQVEGRVIVKVDGAPPTSQILSNPSRPYYHTGEQIIISGTASDEDGSGIKEVRVWWDNETYHLAEGKEAWAYQLSMPGDGPHTLHVQAVDQVGNVQTSPVALTYLVDGNGPEVTTTTANETTLKLERDEQGRYFIPLNGSFSDPAIANGEPGSGVKDVYVNITPNGTGWQRPTENFINQRWWINYPLVGADANGQLLNPTGVYTVQLRGIDMAGNDTAGDQMTTLTLRVDNTAPLAKLVLPDPGKVTQTETGSLIEVPERKPLTGPGITFSGTVAEVGDVRTGLDRAVVRFLSADKGLAPGLWTIWYRNNSFQSGSPEATATTAEIDFDWGEGSPDTAIYKDGFTADFNRQSLFMVSGNYAFTVNHAPGSVTKVFVDDQQVLLLGEKDGATRTLKTHINVGVHNLRVLYMHGNGPARVKFDVDLNENDVDWQAASLAESGSDIQSTTWTYRLPEGMEGFYRMGASGVDTFGNVGQDFASSMQWQGEIDNTAPRLRLDARLEGSGVTARTIYSVSVTDFNLVESSVESPCPIQADDRVVYDSAYWRQWGPGQDRLYQINSQCTVNGHQPATVALKACDQYGQCASTAASTPEGPDTRTLYWLNAQGGVSSVERMSIPNHQTAKIYTAPAGAVLNDMVSDPEKGQLYLAESGTDGTQPTGRVWSMDGSAGSIQALYADNAPGDVGNDPLGLELSGGMLYWSHQNGADLSTMPQAGAAPGKIVLQNVIDFAVDAKNQVIVAAQSSGMGYDKLVFLNMQGQVIGSLTPDANFNSWLSIYQLKVDPVSKAIFFTGTYQYRMWYGLMRVPYPARFDLHQTGVTSGTRIVIGSIDSFAVDPEAKKIYYVEHFGDYYTKLYRVNTDGSSAEQLLYREGEQNIHGLALLPNQGLVVENSSVTIRAGEGGFISLNAYDPLGGPVTYRMISPPAHPGNSNLLPEPVSSVSPYKIAYFPPGDFSGSDRMVVGVSNTRGDQAQIVVDINILPQSLIAVNITAPTDGALLTSLDPAPVTIAMQAAEGASELEWTVNKVTQAKQTWNLADGPLPTEKIWTTSWTPPAEGHYYLTAYVRHLVNYTSGAMATNSVWVDTSVPTVTLDDTSPILAGSARLLGDKTVILRGTASDTNGLASVEVRVNGGGWEKAAWNAGTQVWQLYRSDPALPGRAVFHVEVRATDVAGRTSETTSDLVVNNKLPEASTVTLSNNGTPFTAPNMVRSAPAALQMSWTASPTAAQYWAGWTTSETPNQAALTQVAPEGPLNLTQQISEGQVVWAHLGIIDQDGNARWQSFGPVTIDAPATDDVIRHPSLPNGLSRAWLSSGASKLGEMVFPKGYQGQPQAFFTTWNSSDLAFAWHNKPAGAHVFIYLDVKPGGTRTAYNPYGSGMEVGLPADNGRPLEADYLIWAKGGTNAVLLTWNGSAWEDKGSLLAYEDSDLISVVPFASLGITNPAATALDLVAFTSAPDRLAIASIFPAKNPLNSPSVMYQQDVLTGITRIDLLQQYHWQALGANQIPNAGQYTAADVVFSVIPTEDGLRQGYHSSQWYGRLSSSTWLDADGDGVAENLLNKPWEPKPAANGTVMHYKISYTNNGSDWARGLTARLATRGALHLPQGASETLTLGDLGPGATAQAEFTLLMQGTPDQTTGEVRVELSDTVMGPFDWAWVFQKVDPVVPEVTLRSPMNAQYVPAGPINFTGTVTDYATVNRIDLLINGARDFSCYPYPLATENWSCDGTAGVITGSYTVQARARDLSGNLGSWSAPVTVKIDENPPEVELDEATRLRLHDQAFRDQVVLTGNLTDEMAAARVQVCPQAATCVEAVLASPGQPVSTWRAEIPVRSGSDAAAEYFDLYGFDERGNSSVAIRELYTADNIAPTLRITQEAERVPLNPSQTNPPRVLYGEALDGGLTKTIYVDVTGPTPAQTTQRLTITPSASTRTWEFKPNLLAVGQYTLLLTAEDAVGNLSTPYGPYTLTVTDSADLSVGISASIPQLESAPSDYSYTLTVTNHGPSQASGVEARFALPLGSIYQSNSCGVTGQVTSMFTWAAGDLPAGASRECTVSLHIGQIAAARLETSLTVHSATEELYGYDNYTFNDLPALIKNAPRINFRSDSAGVFYAYEGGSVSLDASSSYDPDEGQASQLQFAWDLDNDGAYDDASGAVVTFSTASINGDPVGVDRPVRLLVTDPDGLTDSASAVVRVFNKAPIVEIGEPRDAVQGESLTFTAQVSDPSPLDVVTTTWTVRSPEMAITSLGSGLTVSYTFMDRALYTVCARSEDSDGESWVDCVNIDVANAAPTVDAGQDLSGSEGSPVTLRGGFTDPSLGQYHHLTWDFGDGSPEQQIWLDSTETVLPEITHTYRNEGVYTARLTVSDYLGASGTDTLLVSVANTAPVVQAGEAVTLHEGDTYQFTGSVTDAGPDDVLTYEWRFGDGETTPSISAAHTYPQDGVFTAELVASDSISQARGSRRVTVENVAPVLGDFSFSTSGEYRRTLTIQGMASDVGLLDNLSLSVDWADGTTSAASVNRAAGAAAGTFTLTHTYADTVDTGVALNLTLTLSDDDTAVSQSQEVMLNANPEVGAIECIEITRCEWNAGDHAMISGWFIDSDGIVGTDRYFVHWDIVGPDGRKLDIPLEVNDPENPYVNGYRQNDYWVDFTENGSDPQTGVSAELYPVFETPGDNEVTLTVTDQNGKRGSFTRIMTIGKARPVIAILGGSRTVDEGTTIDLQGTIDGSTAYNAAEFPVVRWQRNCTGSEESVDDDLMRSFTFEDTCYAMNGGQPYALDYAVYLYVERSDRPNDGEMGYVRVSVNNVAPSASQITTNLPIAVGMDLALSAHLHEPGKLDWVDWTVDWGDGTQPASGRYAAGAVPETDTWRHPYNAAGSYTTRLTLTDKDGGTHAYDIPVTVAAGTLAARAGDDQVLVENEAATFSGAQSDLLTGNGPYTYTWDFGDGTPQVNGQTIQHRFTQLGAQDALYTVTLTVTGKNGSAQDTLTARVKNAAPVFANLSIGDVAEGAAAVLSGTVSDPGAADTLALEVDWGDGTAAQTIAGITALGQSHVYADNGTYTVRLDLRDGDGGLTHEERQVKVSNAAPTASIQITGGLVAGQAVDFSATAADAGKADTISYRWEMGDGATYITPSVRHTYTQAGARTVRLTVTDKDGGSTTVTRDISVTSAKPVVDAGADVIVREGAAVTFNGQAPSGATLAWTFGDGGTAVNTLQPSHAFKNQGTYTVTLTATTPDQISGSDSLVVQVANVPPSITAINPPAEIISGLPAVFTLAFNDPGVEDALKLTIDWGDGTVEQKNYPAGTTSAAPAHTYAAAFSGSAIVRLTLEDESGGTVRSQAVQVTRAIIRANAGPDQTKGEGSLVTFNGSFTNPLGQDGESYAWDFGDGSTASGSLNPSHLYKDEGTFTVTLRVSGKNAMAGQDSLIVTVQNGAPVFQSPALSPISEGGTTTLSGTVSDPGPTDVLTLLIDWGDGSNIQTIQNVSGLGQTHTYAGSGSYTVHLILRDADGGETRLDLPMTVTNSAPTASILAQGPFYLNAESQFTAVVSDAGVKDTFAYAWTMDGSAVGNTSEIRHTFDRLGAHTIALTVTDQDGGISQPVQLTITVVSPTARIEVSADQTHVVEGQAVNFSAMVNGGMNTTGLSLLWDFGDDESTEGGLTSTHTYRNNGHYQVQLSAVTEDQVVSVGTVELTVDNAAPVFGEIPASVTVQRGAALSLTVPFSDAGADDAHDLTVTWQDGKVERFHYLAGVTEAALSHTYALEVGGTMTITLTLEDADLGKATAQVGVVIEDRPVAVSAGVDIQDAMEGSPVAFKATVANPILGDTTLLTWNFGDGTVTTSSLSASGLAPAHTYTDEGAYTVTLTAAGKYAKSASSTLSVTVRNADPVITNAVVTSPVSENSVVTLSGVVMDPGAKDSVSAAIDWGDNSGVQSIPAVTGTLRLGHTYTDNATYTITLTLTDGDGGRFVRTYTSRVDNAAPAAVLTLPGLIEVGQAVDFTAAVSDPSPVDAVSLTYQWKMGDGATYEKQNVSHTYLQTGAYTVTFTVTDKDGGSQTITRPVQVYGKVIAVEAGDAVSGVKEGESVHFDGTINSSKNSEGYTVAWDFGDGTTSSDLMTDHAYANNGTYTATLTVSRDGESFSDTRRVQVVNVAPVIGEISGETTVKAGHPVHLIIPIFDPGADTLKLRVNWGDEQIETLTYPAGTTQAIIEHIYDRQRTGEISALLTLSDADQGRNDTLVKLTLLAGVDLSVSLTGPQSAMVGTEQTYQMEVSNNGGADATGLIAHLHLPDGASLVKASATCQAVSDEIQCPAGDLKAGERLTMTVTIRLGMQMNGPSVLQVSFSAQEEDINPDNNQASLTLDVEPRLKYFLPVIRR